ncbi:hypothetical protein [Raoultella sp. R2A007]|uniref:hypothetical protein n=1 Tax=Raoultella sp. R2A007 TaxID=3416669 RepID=UPI003CEDE686
MSEHGDKKVNKHRLSRYIPASTAKEIREEAGYGCVICGALFADYEHIEPEFHEAVKHEASKMTLLCGTHHDDVSYGRMHKDEVWEAKANPYNKNRGFISSAMRHQTNTSKIYFGNNAIGRDAVNYPDLGLVAIKLNGKPILWFEKSDGPCAPIKTCAIFYHKDSIPYAFINRNILTKELDGYDVLSISSRVEIRRGAGDIALILNFPGRGDIMIEYFKMELDGFCVVVNKSGDFIYTNDSGTRIKLSSTSTGMLNFGSIIENNKFYEGERSKLSFIVESALYGVKIIAYNGEVLGWFISLSGFVINKRYLVVGNASSDEGGEAYFSTLIEMNVAKGFTSKTDSGEIVYLIRYEEDSYDTGEPIWICTNDRASKNTRSDNNYDLSYRFFDLPGVYD